VVDIIEGYETEEQQVDAIKRWWHENGTMLIVGAVVGLAGLWGWRYYGESVTASQEKASTEFSQVTTQLAAQDDDKSLTELNTFIADNKDSNYSTLAGLLVAKHAVDAKDFAGAKTQLTELLKNNDYEPLIPVITLRLARVQSELGDYDAAIANLDNITQEGFLVKVNQSKGEVYLKQGNTEAARKAFQAAVDASEGRIDPILQLQLDDLAVAEQKIAPAPKLDAAQ
jgi:predicted negative regulator of RcsB-dependent stress response